MSEGQRPAYHGGEAKRPPKAAGPLRDLSEDAAIEWLVGQFRASLTEHRGTVADAIRHGHADLVLLAQVRNHGWLGLSVERVKVVSSAA